MIRSVVVTGALFALSAQAGPREDLANDIARLAARETRSTLSAAQLESIANFRVDQFKGLCGQTIERKDFPNSDELAHGLYIYLRQTPPFLLTDSMITGTEPYYMVIPNKRETTGGDPTSSDPRRMPVAYAKFIVGMNMSDKVVDVIPNILGYQTTYDLCDF